MRIFHCCFSATNLEREAKPQNRAAEDAERRFGTSFEPESGVSDLAGNYAPLQKVCQYALDQGWQDSIFISNGTDSGSGLECALLLQAKLCAQTKAFPEARAGGLVDIIQKHLDASAVRLYVLTSGCGTHGAARSVEGELVQLAQALSQGRRSAGQAAVSAPAPSFGGAACDGGAGNGGCRTPPPADTWLPPATADYLCPKHEPVGSSSVLLRQALVSKVPVVHKCAARPEPATRPAAAPAPLATAQQQPGVTAAASIDGAGCAKPSPAFSSVRSLAAMAAARSGSSGGYSSCQGHAGVDGAAAAAAVAAAASRCDVRCCPDLDLTEADAVAGSTMLFAAVPLMYGMKTLGVLWIAVPTASAPTALEEEASPTAQTDVSTVATDSNVGLAAAAAGSGAPRAGLVPRAATHGSSALTTTSGGAALLTNRAGLELVSMAVAMHLAAGCADANHVAHLGEALYGLSESTTLAELVLELSNSLVRHVRQRFFVDATAHVALVPAADSRVAFMLRPERAEGAASARAARQQHLMFSRLRMASLASVVSSTTNNLLSNLAGGTEINRSRSITVAAQAAASISRRGSTNPTNPHPASLAAQNSDLQRAYATAAAAEGNHPTPTRACSLSALRASVARDVFMLESSVVRSDGSLGLLSTGPPGGATAAAAGFPPPSLSARAFRLSNTLLQVMLHAATVQRQHQQRGGGAGGVGSILGDRAPKAPKLFDASSGSGAAAAGGGSVAPGGVLLGMCVRDCARHVQDERQPSRDVCMLMMAGGERAGGGAGSSSVRGTMAATISEPAAAVAMASGGGAASGGGGAGAQSLVLLGMETGDGAVLAVYLAFPTPAPMQLLRAVQEGCSVMLREHLATLIRHRLRCADLAAEWDTLRAGVPGSYLSVSRASILPPSEPYTASLATAASNGGGGAVACIQPPLPLSQPHGRRAPPQLLIMSAGSNVVHGGGPDDVAGGGGGYLVDGALSTSSSHRGGVGTFSPRGGSGGDHAGELGSMPGTAPAAVAMAGSEASLVSLAPGMGGQGTSPGMGYCRNPSHTGHSSAGGHASGGGGLVRSSKMSVAQGGIEDAGLTLGGPSWLQRTRRSASAVSPANATSARSTSARGMFLRGLNGKQPAGGGGSDPAAAAPPGSGCFARLRSEQSSGCFAMGRPADGVTSPVGPLTAEVDDEDQAAWPDSTAAGPGGGAVAATVAAAGMLTVHDLDETYESWGMRAHLGALVDSILSTTLRSSGAHLRPDDGGAGAEMAAARVTEGLEELQLSAVLGQGASGVVLRGTLGCTPVAVKIMEMPDADASIGGQGASPDDKAGRGAGDCLGSLQGSSDEEVTAAAFSQGLPYGRLLAATGVEAREIRARRALLRNAMEVALMRSISHVNVVQAFGVYDNVIMERHEGRQGIINLRRINQRDAQDTAKVSDASAPGSLRSSPICTAIVMELCDRGSLADVMHNRSFPALPQPPPHPSVSPGATAGVAMQYGRYWKGVYMTLLEIALALRHLHSRKLVHRDLKPGNILLKSSPGDPRGWTCKLADFGFAMVLDKLLEQPLPDDGVGGPTDSSQGTLLGTGHCSSSSSSNPLAKAHALQPPTTANSQPSTSGMGTGTSTGNVGPRDWFTIQQHIGGTVTHMAPEAFKKGSRIDAGVDVFSFGIIMWELVCSRGHRPYKELALDAIGPAVAGGTRPMFPPGDNVPMPYRQLARSCWSADPRVRPSAAELVTAVKGLLESVSAKRISMRPKGQIVTRLAREGVD